MKNKILLLFVVILFVIYISKGSIQDNTSFFDYSLVIKNTTTNEMFEIKMEDYLIGVVAAEMPASYEKEALKAQAVAARTYAYYKSFNKKGDYDLTTDNTTQVYIDNNKLKKKWGSKYDEYYSKITAVINETKDEVITFDGGVISAYYFSMSNGKTENSIDVFNENKPYLVSVDSLENESLKNYSRTNIITKLDFCNKLSLKNCNNIKVNNIVYNDTHHVSLITINNISFKGTEFRKLLKIYSTDFSIEINKDEILIKCNGNGHDVGMSQYGANLMAQKGNNYIDILKHYYTGVNIEKINV